MRTADAGSRALSVSRKDRGAILPLGRSNQPAFWYSSGSGRFTTSTWFADTLPTWVRQFNERRIPQSYAGHSWTLLAPESQYAERDSVPIESGGTGFVFPHILPTDSTRAATLLVDFPFEFALYLLLVVVIFTGVAAGVIAISRLPRLEHLRERWSRSGPRKSRLSLG